MCNKTCIDFGKANLCAADVRGKSVIEVGSLNVNGSLRRDIEALGPASYIGVDIQMGSGVDRICRVEGLVRMFGREAFDVVVSTELIEHVKDWQAAIYNLKSVLRPGGVTLITTRSKGFKYHGYPYDFWRYEADDLRAIFADFEIKSLQSDSPEPGIFLFARKPLPYTRKDIRGIKLQSVIMGRRVPVFASRLYWSVVARPLSKLIGKRRWIETLKI